MNITNNGNDKNKILVEEFSEIDDLSGKEFLAEIKENPENIKKLLEEFINISYRYEKDVKDTKALYEWLIEMLPQAIWVCNPDGSFFYTNSLASALNDMLDSIQNEIQDDEAAFELDYKNETFFVQTNVFQNRRLITAIDITKQKRQERLASMGQISAHLAHEIRNPIGSMSLLLSVLNKNSNPKQSEIINEIQKSIFRVERIIKATLLFSKGITLNKAAIELDSLLYDLNESLKTYSYTKEINFNFNFEQGVCFVDRDLIVIALQNFLFNAIDAIEESENEQGEVIINASIVGDEVAFIIQDNGIAFKNKNALFEPFMTTKLKGNGLGLALSLQIISAHNGRIDLDLESKKFSIFIPKV